VIGIWYPSQTIAEPVSMGPNTTIAPAICTSPAGFDRAVFRAGFKFRTREVLEKTL
jgi:hypothetical protein